MSAGVFIWRYANKADISRLSSRMFVFDSKRALALNLRIAYLTQ